MYDGTSKGYGFIIDSFDSIAEVVKIMRNYTDDSISEIRTKIAKRERSYNCSIHDDDGIRKMIKCINELKKKNVRVTILDKQDDIINMQLLKNWLSLIRDVEIETEAETELEVSEVDPSDIEKYSFLWDGTEKNWAVLKGDYEYTIYNTETEEVFGIRDEDLNNAVAAMMIMQGNEVIDVN